MTTEREMRRQVRARTGELLDSGHLQHYDVPGIVAEIEDRHGIVDVTAMGDDEFWQIAAEHDIRSQVRAEAVQLLGQARNLLDADRGSTRDERADLSGRFHQAMSRLGDINAIRMNDPERSSAIENLDNVLHWWNCAGHADGDPRREEGRAKLASLFEVLDARIQAEGAN
ncbi:MAG TPA: hypothetical protein VLT58_07815 [Polyangia bacterium]|nr:hypothetical protein [Polyangia bacterium]